MLRVVPCNLTKQMLETWIASSVFVRFEKKKQLLFLKENFRKLHFQIKCNSQRKEKASDKNLKKDPKEESLQRWLIILSCVEKGSC